MKFSFIFLFIVGLQMYATGYSQSRISMNAEGMTIRETLKQIEKQTGYRFFYSDDLVLLDQKIDLHAVNSSIDEILGRLFKTSDLGYRVFENNTVIVSVKERLQGITISGTVADNKGDPMPGVNVVAKGTMLGTVTDIDGKYTLNVPNRDAVLIYSFIGYVSQEITVADQTRITVTLLEDTREIEEVVVVGYGTMQKKQVTSSIQSLSSRDLPVGVGGTDIATALQGKIAGLVMAGNDSPNSESNFQLRGMGSINASKSPLVVIDGMPGGDIRNIAPEEIQSIDVLKDASAGAIYGTRGASGVILITTKQAQAGQLKLSYTGEMMIRQVVHKPQMLNASEYMATKNGATDFGSNTDWFDEAINNNSLSNRQLITLQGGQENARIYASVGYENNNGIMKFDSRKDYSGRINGEFKVLDGWLDITTHVTYRQASRDRRFDREDMEGILRTDPTKAVRDPDSQTGWNIWTAGDDVDVNKIAEGALQSREAIDKWFRPDVSFRLNIKPVKGLSYRQSVAYENRQYENHQYDPSTMRSEIKAGRKGTAKLEFSKTELLNTDGYFSYVNGFGKHYINATAGWSYFEQNKENFDMQNRNFSVDAVKFWNMGNGTYLKNKDASKDGIDMNSNKDITRRLTAFFGRANYSYDDRYMATASIRREGTSKLAEDNRWGNFWALSAGWRISKEQFMENVSWLDDLKIRAAYGVTGDEGFSADYAARMFGTDTYWLMPNGKWAQSYGVTRNINNELRWEENHEWNIGFDFSVFDNRLWGSFDWYDRTKVGMIFNVDVPQPPNTEDKMYKNIGDFKNRGWEIQLGGNIIRTKDFTWTSALNLTHNKTTVGTLYGDKSYMNGGSINNWVQWAHRLEEGVEVGSYFLYRYAGIDADGKFQVYNRKGEVIPTEKAVVDDRVYQGHATPSLIAGWSHNLSYKNWSLAFTLTSWINYDVYNSIELEYGLKGVALVNMLHDAIGKNAHITGGPSANNFFLYDGTFLKLQNLTVAYRLPMHKWNNVIQDIKLYATGNNLFRITKYPGMNPEVDINDWEWAGVERKGNLYPQTRMFTLGVQLNF